MLMWSHYSDGLRGFCINYDAKELYRSLKELNPNCIFATYKIDYDKKPREIDLLSACNEEDISYIKALQIKHEQWSYECECRIFCNQVGLRYFSQDSVKYIFIGDKMPNNEAALLIKLVEANYPNAEIKRIKIDEESFCIKVGKKI